MIRTLLLSALFLFSSVLVAQPVERQLTGTVSFEIKEFVFSTVKGSFSDVQGQALIDSGVLTSFEACP